ncbi:MAG: hypothetical protein Q9164_002271 [Protoblastenia rupestris]
MATAPRRCSLSFFVPGKQIVYHAIQGPNDALCLDDLAAMDKEITSLRDEVATLKSNEKLLRSNLASVNATMSTAELRSHVQSLLSEKAEVLARLGPLRKGDVKPVSAAEKEAINYEWTIWKRRSEMRKKMAMELWAMGTEVVPEDKSKEDIWEELGLEEDE